ncbi:NAD(P)-dependent oxidoreductase [Aestuariivirga sp.]|uniref:NAD(P)-dependent oxidoreductase n=1 Tax=Aestuariivirga sp. TaxID=2650926 RepID=UPI0039E41F7F
MTLSPIRIGVTADLFDSTGRPLFGTAPFKLFADAGLAWEKLPPCNPVSPEYLADYDALFLGGAKVREEDLKLDKGRLRVLARNGVGFDALDIPALTRRGILVTNTPVAVRHSVATIALAFLLSLSLRLPLKSRLPREGRWAERGDYPGIGLPGRTIGLIGFGGIGQEFVRLLKPFNLRVVVADPFTTDAVCAQHGCERMDLDALLATSDFVVVACLLDARTRHLLNAERLKLMKPSAFVINVARGPIIDEAALIHALQSGIIAGAALDVVEKEPPDPGNPLFTMENVIVTPHSLCWTDTFMDECVRTAIKSVIDVVQGRLPEFVVNRDAIGQARVNGWLKTAAATAS